MSKLGLVEDLLSFATKGAAKEAPKAAPKVAKPFYSAADKAAMELTRGKGTGKEFITELKKAPGVKKAELEHRKLEQIEAMPKMTKEEFLAELEKRPPAKLEEITYSDNPQEQEYGDLYYQTIGHLPREEQTKAFIALPEAEKERIYKESKESDKHLQGTKYEKWLMPGAENYREILIKTPSESMRKAQSEIAGLRKEYNAYDAQAQAIRQQFPIISERPPEAQTELMNLREKQAALENEIRQISKEGQTYHSGHWENDPGVLAHARVTDRWGPNNEQILHIEEIQSDWHQAGRKSGYKTGEEAAQIDELNNQMQALSKRRKELHNAAGALPDGREDDFIDLMNQANDITPQIMSLQSKIDELAGKSVRAVPDAPFKKNWHELVMKRLLNYAAERGYDKVVITPGAEQASRYDLSKHLENINIHKNQDGTYNIIGNAHGAESFRTPAIQEFNIPEDKLESYIGKDLALKAVNEGGGKYEGLDLRVGGEGMIGFYDKMLPDYLNTFGKKYGVQVQKEGYPIKISPDLNFPEEISRANNLPSFVPGEERMLHSFDITPEMREEIKGGMPLYQKIGIPTGAGAAGQTCGRWTRGRRV
jgi:prefoldin subunit 5